MKARRPAVLAALLALALAGSGCERKPEPVILRSAFIERSAHRDAIEGRDTTLARLTYPEFVGARTPEALDSLRATVHALLVAPPGGRGRAVAGPEALMDGFIATWNATRKATHSRAYWWFDRRIEVLAETLGVVSFATSEFLYTGGAHSASTVRFVNVGADDGRTLRFADVFRAEARDSLSAALETWFREARGIAPDSSLKAAGFGFAGDRFQVNENFAITTDGLRWHFDPYEIAPYAWGATDFVVPFDAVRDFVRPAGPRGAGSR